MANVSDTPERRTEREADEREFVACLDRMASIREGLERHSFKASEIEKLHSLLTDADHVAWRDSEGKWREATW